jgi:hypothetical protein
MAKSTLDVILQGSQSLLLSAKDAAAANIVAACRSGQLKVENTQVQKLLQIVSMSVDEGFNRAFKSFSKTVEAQLAAEATTAAMPALTSKNKR